MATGTATPFSDQKGFGFRSPDGGGKDLFVHRSAIAASDTLTEGLRVEFKPRAGQKRPQATKVAPSEA